jgi:hypothetical protein
MTPEACATVVPGNKNAAPICNSASLQAFANDYSYESLGNNTAPPFWLISHVFPQLTSVVLTACLMREADVFHSIRKLPLLSSLTMEGCVFNSAAVSNVTVLSGLENLRHLT